MLDRDVLNVIKVLEAANLRVWLDGGWGVDALLGTQTRAHEDMDLVVELSEVSEVVSS